YTASKLHNLFQPLLLRRVKAEVATELPKKTEVVIYHVMSALQKKYYKAILMKDQDAFENEMAKKVKLQNSLSQLQKCVDHPYLFDGVKPEPFEVGDHLIEANGKLHLLDELLDFLHFKYSLFQGHVPHPASEVFIQLSHGGIGMNLTAADTVIFVDSDFNSQNDLQAAARAQQIDQNKCSQVLLMVPAQTTSFSPNLRTIGISPTLRPLEGI
ncbi:Chromodomain-helicase-DNA-binding protein 1-like, partial [Sciurus carolinensis]|nr:Chromodomain-helicase-DNA-binding protein 1-like [Sciurus carolinensis]